MQRAGIVDEDVLEHVERLGVEVVGRFVEHQHVGGLGEQASQQQAVAFAAGEHLRLRAGAGRV
jgi:hypothetical protein